MVPVSFLQRPYPSANVVLLHGSRPVLVDTGFGADSAALLRAHPEISESGSMRLSRSRIPVA